MVYSYSTLIPDVRIHKSSHFRSVARRRWQDWIKCSSLWEQCTLPEACEPRFLDIGYVVASGERLAYDSNWSKNRWTGILVTGLKRFPDAIFHHDALSIRYFNKGLEMRPTETNLRVTPSTKQRRKMYTLDWVSRENIHNVHKKIESTINRIQPTAELQT